jgi:hypothetical protein
MNKTQRYVAGPPSVPSFTGNNEGDAESFANGHSGIRGLKTKLQRNAVCLAVVLLIS